MYIYRIEHKETGRGPYNPDEDTIYPDDRLYGIKNAHSSDLVNHPSMWIDCELYDLIAPAHCYYCGFSTIEQLIQWFDQWFDVLHNNGFTLAIYRISQQFVRSGSKQVIFNKSRASSRKIIDLDSVAFLEMIGY